MKLIPFQAEHFLAIDWQESQRPFAHLATAEVADSVVAHGEGLTLLADDGAIVATAGVVPMRVLLTHDGTRIPHSSYAVAALSTRFRGHVKSVMVAIRRFLDARPEQKIIMHVWPADAKAARFAKRLGFQFERVEYEEAIGADLHVYARVRVTH
ncbi:MAG: hypothetical protein AB7O04_12590 [Hyphomonadaceae bacterium]